MPHAIKGGDDLTDGMQASANLAYLNQLVNQSFI
jgi:hypothetical protein